MNPTLSKLSYVSIRFEKSRLSSIIRSLFNIIMIDMDVRTIS